MALASHGTPAANSVRFDAWLLYPAIWEIHEDVMDKMSYIERKTWDLREKHWYTPITGILKSLVEV